MDKNFGLAMMVPGIWLASVLALILETLISPVAFFVALFNPMSPQDIIDQITGVFE
jgi:hypothetical protein